MEQELLVMLNIDAKWERFLLPGPIAVATLGQLVVISGKRDFPFRNINLSKLKFLRHSNFRPALIQVLNDGWKAFRLANRNMERIKLSMAELPVKVRQAMRYLGSPKPKVIQRLLPIPLNGIERIAKSCVALSEGVDDVFLDMVGLLGEVDEALSGTDAWYREGLLNITREREVVQLEREQLKKLHALAKKEFSKVSKQLDADRAKYEKALKKIPTGWKAAFMDMVRGLNPMQMVGMFMGSGGPLSRLVGRGRNSGSGGAGGSTLAGGISGKLGGVAGLGKGGGAFADILGKFQMGANFKFGDVLKGFLKGKFKKGSNKGKNGAPKEVFVTQHNLNQEYALNHAENVFHSLNQIIPEIQDFVQKASKGGSAVGNVNKQLEDLIAYLQAKKSGAETLRETLTSKGDSAWKKPAIDALNSFITKIGAVITGLKAQNPLSGENLNKITKMIPGLQSMQKETGKLVSVRAIKSGTITPRVVMSQKTPSGKMTGTGAAERYIAAQRQSTLYETQKRYDLYFAKVQEATTKLNDVMRKLSQLDMEEVNFKEIRQVLAEAINAVASLKKQFDQLIRFFQIISGVVAVTLKERATSFLDTARALGVDPEDTRGLIYDDPTMEVRDAIVGDASRIATVSKFLYTLTDVYVTVSNRYIMDQIAEASALQTLPKTERQGKLAELFEKGQTAQAEIMKLVEDKRAEFKRSVKKSESEIKEMFNLLGKPTQDELDNVKSAEVIVAVQTELENREDAEDDSPYAASCLLAGC
jgi:hypothetical protein